MGCLIQSWGVSFVSQTMEETAVGGESRNCKGAGDDVGCASKRWAALDGSDEEEVSSYAPLPLLSSLSRRNFWILDISNCASM